MNRLHYSIDLWFGQASLQVVLVPGESALPSCTSDCRDG